MSAIRGAGQIPREWPKGAAVRRTCLTDRDGGSGFREAGVMEMADMDKLLEPLRAFLGPLADLRTDGTPVHAMGVTLIDPGLGVKVTDPRCRALIHLDGRAEALAAKLHERFGATLEIKLGALPYPLREDHEVRERRPPAVTADNPGIDVELRLTTPAVASGHDARGSLLMSNVTGRPFSFSTGVSLVGVLVDPVRDVVVGTSTALWPLVALGHRLPPHETRSMPVVIGTTSCDPSLGYVLPPGVYNAMVGLDIDLSSGRDFERTSGVIAVASAPLELT